MNWKIFLSKTLPKIIKMAGLGQTCVSRYAASQMVTAAAIIAAEKKSLEGSILQAYNDFCQDSNTAIRKKALSNWKLLFHKLNPSEVEYLFFSEVKKALKIIINRSQFT